MICLHITDFDCQTDIAGVNSKVKLRRVDGTCYSFEYDATKSYNHRQAQSKCKSNFGNGVKGTIFEPRSQQVMEKVFGVATELWNSVPYDSWKNTRIGVIYDQIDEKFKYVSDGNPIMISPWSSGQPDSYDRYGNNTCVLASWYKKYWWDVECDESSSIEHVICEVERN